METNEKYLQFRKALSNIAQSEDGKVVAEFLIQAYVDVSVMDERPRMMDYKTGQKELIQGLIKDASADVKPIENLVRGG